MSKQDKQAPVLTIDGPSGSGKGTISKLLSTQLGWHYLDSGAIYRALGIAAIERQIDIHDEAAVSELINLITLEFKRNAKGEWGVFLDAIEVQDRLQTEAVGQVASVIAALPKVREGLLLKQQAFRCAPGLVADGRDMGSMVFAGAKYKVYLTASAQERGKRRYKQLIEKGIDANLSDVIQDIESRDSRDKSRAASPLVIPDGALLIDSSTMSIDDVVQEVLQAMDNR